MLAEQNKPKPLPAIYRRYPRSRLQKTQKLVKNDKTALGDLNLPPTASTQVLANASEHPAMQTTELLPIQKIIYNLSPEGQTTKVNKNGIFQT